MTPLEGFALVFYIGASIGMIVIAIGHLWEWFR